MTGYHQKKRQSFCIADQVIFGVLLERFDQGPQLNVALVAGAKSLESIPDFEFSYLTKLWNLRGLADLAVLVLNR